jgi:hypothetical protein
MLGVMWLVASLGGGALLALLGKRVHPRLSYRKMWVFYSGLLGVSAALLFAIGIF